MPQALEILDLEQLEQDGALFKEKGRIWVRVLIHDPHDLGSCRRSERQQYLLDEFRRLRESKTFSAVSFDFDRVSVSGQTVCADIPWDALPAIVEQLHHEGFAVVPNSEFKGD